MKEHVDVAEVKRLLQAYCPSGNVWDLAGRHKASVRAHIMASALGTDRVPQKVAGITALSNKLHALAQTTGNCQAVRDRNLRIWIEEKT